MSMDFETVRFMRFLCAIVFAIVGAGGGTIYFGTTGGIAGGVIGLIVGWNVVDLFKGRAHK